MEEDQQAVSTFKYSQIPPPGTSAGDMLNLEKSNVEEDDVNMDDESKRKDSGDVTEESRRYLAQQTQEVIVPSYSTWFSFDAIHDIEQNALPEFFSGKSATKTPTIYKDYRDFMINAYRLNPAEYLTVTACRRNLAGLSL